jgi:arsenate reductase
VDELSTVGERCVCEQTELIGSDMSTVSRHLAVLKGLVPGTAKETHVGFDDPPRLAKEATTEEEALSHYRRVRDEIRTFVETLPEALDS